ncbi:MAG: ABC transporter permease [Chthoniobacteraceae bacterium]
MNTGEWKEQGRPGVTVLDPPRRSQAAAPERADQTSGGYGPGVALFLFHSIQYLLVPVGLVILWDGLFRAGVVRGGLLPSPARVWTTLWGLAASGQLLVHVLASLARVLEGFAVAAVAGLVLGVGIGISTHVARLVDLVIQILRPIPPIAWIPLAILWFGIGELSKVYIIFLGAFFPIIMGVVEGIRQTDSRYVELANVLEVSRLKFIRKVVLPGALPSIITGLRVGLGTAWVCVVAAELIAAERGVGYIIVDGRELVRPDVVIAGMITIGVIGKLMDVLLKYLESWLVGWRTQYSGT